MQKLSTQLQNLRSYESEIDWRNDDDARVSTSFAIYCFSQQITACMYETIFSNGMIDTVRISLGQRNRAASVSNDPLSMISPNGQDQELSEETWNFATDDVLLDPFLIEQDCNADLCHQHSTTVTNAAGPGTNQVASAEQISLLEMPNTNGNGLSEPQIVSCDAKSDSATLQSSITSPLHQFLLALRNGKQTGLNGTDASMLNLSRTVSGLVQSIAHHVPTITTVTKPATRRFILQISAISRCTRIYAAG